MLLSFSGLLCCAPIFCLVIPILRFTGEGEVFYIQERVGAGHRSFGLFKFATMVKNAAKIGPGEITLHDDPRVLPFGIFLRKSKINELPQLLNVLRGDMSMVGPRPLTRRYFDLHTDELKASLWEIRPGLSGIGSIVFRDEEKILKDQRDPVWFDDNVLTPYKSKLELWFVQNAGLRMYFKVIAATALVVLFPRLNVREMFFSKSPSPPSDLCSLFLK